MDTQNEAGLGDHPHLKKEKKNTFQVSNSLILTDFYTGWITSEKYCQMDPINDYLM